MSSKKRSSNPSDSGAAETPRSGGRGPSTIAIAFAILGLGALVFALVVTGDPPERRRRSVAVASDVDQWAAAPQQTGIVSERDYAMGPEDAPVTIVTFSDFECPYCKDASTALATVYQRFPSDVRVVFKNYPLDQACNEYMPRPNHLYACRAALMARCAGEQDKFWEMHDAIFALPRMSMNGLEPLAEQVGLATEEFAECMASEDAESDIQRDIEAGKRAGVSGTPSIFINGRRAPSQDAEAIAAVVQHILDESGN